MRRYLYLYFTLVAVDPAAFAQTTPQDQSALPASRQQQAPVQPQLGRRKDSDQASAGGAVFPARSSGRLLSWPYVAARSDGSRA